MLARGGMDGWLTVISMSSVLTAVRLLQKWVRLIVCLKEAPSLLGEMDI